MKPPPKLVPLGENEQSTGEHPATKDFARHAATVSSIKAILAGIAGIAVAAVVGWREVTREARAQADAGVAVVAQQGQATQRELERYQREVDARMVRVEAQGTRMETKMDALLERLAVQNPAPAPKDGGP